MDARDRNHLLEQLRNQDHLITTQHRNNRELREMIRDLKKENEKLLNHRQTLEKRLANALTWLRIYEANEIETEAIGE